MMPLLRTATSDQAPANDVARLRGLIDSLRTNLETMTADIEAEERTSQISDIENVGYSTLAKSLRARRENLEATIGSLREALAQFER
jgi:hypothetical protein